MKKSKYTNGASIRDKQKFAKFLSEDEELILATGFSGNYLRHRYLYYIIIPGIFFMILGGGIVYIFGGNLGYGILFGLIGSLFFAFIKTLWTHHSHRYLLTTRRVIIKKGVFAVKISSALFDKITHIEVDQGFIDRLIMHHGTVIINTAGGNSDELVLDFVDTPIDFKNILERLINRERELYGKTSGSVVTVEGELVE